MRTSTRNKRELQECYHSPYLKNTRVPLLQNIVEEIKYLQNYVSQMDMEPNHEATLSLKKSLKTPSKRKPASLGHCSHSKEPKKKEKEGNSSNKYQNMKTIRRSPKLENQSVGLRQCGDSFLSRSEEKGKDQERRIEVMEFPMSYISLQFENIELERQNMKLEKKLLEQQLMMERREKQLLKNRLKKIKTHNIINKIPSYSSAHRDSQPRPLPQPSAYDQTPIKIKIPEFKSTHEQSILSYSRSKKQHKVSKNETTKTFESIASFKNDQDTDQLLISRLSNEQHGKQNAGRLQRQFWTLLSQSESEKADKKWEIRQALGDIANKLKAIRKQ